MGSFTALSSPKTNQEPAKPGRERVVPATAWGRFIYELAAIQRHPEGWRTIRWEEAADVLGVDRKTLREWIIGETKSASIQKLEKLADRTGLKYDDVSAIHHERHQGADLSDKSRALLVEYYRLVLTGEAPTIKRLEAIRKFQASKKTRAALARVDRSRGKRPPRDEKE